MSGRSGWAARLDAVFSALGGLAALWLAYLTLVEGISPGWPALLIVVFWALVAYLALPRLHRVLTNIYVPDYFIGRTRTADGLLGDPVNLALDGSEGQLHHALRTSGWTRADALDLRSGWRIVTSTLARRSYPEAPVSPLFLFRRQQDFAYQQEVAGNPSQRHHVRFWRCPDGWPLPGGTRVGWLAAGTFDRSVGLSLFTLQVTHKIAADVDRERDHVVDTVLAANPAATASRLEGFFSGYHARNGGGDEIETDGDLPILDLVAAPDSGERVSKPERSGRPPQLGFGVAATAVRSVAYLVLAALLLGGSAVAVDEAIRLDGATFGAGLAVAGLIDLGLAVATWFRSNVARLLLNAGSVASIASVFFGRRIANEHGPLHLSLLPVAISVLVLLALSSTAARDYVRQPKRNVESRRPT